VNHFLEIRNLLTALLRDRQRPPPPWHEEPLLKDRAGLHKGGAVQIEKVGEYNRKLLK
jgi:hypothetical protein